MKKGIVFVKFCKLKKSNIFSFSPFVYNTQRGGKDLADSLR